MDRYGLTVDLDIGNYLNHLGESIAHTIWEDDVYLRFSSSSIDSTPIFPHGNLAYSQTVQETEEELQVINKLWQ